MGSPLQRSLFAVLAMNADRVVSKQYLIEALWGLTTPPTVESSIYTYVARLRQLLEPQRPRRAPSRFLMLSSSGYRLALEPCQVDALAFTRAVCRARARMETGDLRGALEWFDDAMDLWHGPTPLADAVGPYAEAERARLAEIHFTAVEDRLALLIGLGRPAEVIGELAALTVKYPLRERIRLLLMIAHHRTGRSAEALAEFRDLRQRLVGELGLEPGEELQRYHMQILQGEIGPLPSSVVPALR
ncbi:AfsR/SARP family transcriptional regulator [Nonomuraea sp. MCN248]|uniref:AfsR/SARP family transcriptional regulator n=1 Tax=Nonomuraea corallina TaxID=2989783 RepID=A0ABT4SPD5_9ACTN|nr:AfsR/SARP family transcriptional regulator [Nonomuraea corallina]MDA0638853.1 AfsR/SARP family transcriptional regulator [Nonomuraea corallina]